MKKWQGGQATVEIILMVALTVMVVTLVTQAFKREEYLATLVSGPWRSVAGLVQNGVWGSPEDTMKKHPSQFERVNSVRGKEIQQ